MPKISTALAPDYVPDTKEQALALELCCALEDEANFACYVALTNRYREAHLRNALALAMRVPTEKVKKTRGALFVYLVKNLSGV